MFSFRVGDDIELRLLEERHADQLFALTNQNRAHLREWLPWVDDTQSVEDTQAFIKRALQQFADNNGFQAGIWVEGELAGVIGYHYIAWPSRKTEIGYWLGASFQGRGVMTRVCQALVNYAFNELHLNRIVIYCAAENVKSRAIPERLGFRQEGVLRQAEWLYDHFVDLVVYSILAAEWQSGAHCSAHRIPAPRRHPV